MKPLIQIKRAYDAPSATDTCRILVDRIWPRGIRKEWLALDDWSRDLAPSVALRKWWGHDPSLWNEFKDRYTFELSGNIAVDVFVETWKTKEVITLIYAAKSEVCNHALVLQAFLQRRFDKDNSISRRRSLCPERDSFEWIYPIIRLMNRKCNENRKIK